MKIFLLNLFSLEEEDVLFFNIFSKYLSARSALNKNSTFLEIISFYNEFLKLFKLYKNRICKLQNGVSKPFLYFIFRYLQYGFRKNHILYTEMSVFLLIFLAIVTKTFSLYHRFYLLIIIFVFFFNFICNSIKTLVNNFI